MPKPYQPRDSYFLRAKREGYRARSAYKLLEIQEKFRIVRPNDRILDLGSAPGSFLQVLQSLSPQSPEIIGIDLQKIEPIPGVATFVCDIFDEKKMAEILAGRIFDIVTSDLAPKTSGISDIDQARSAELSLCALDIARRYLRSGGSAVFKVFSGADFASFLRETKAHFQKVSVFKPQASRDRSRECFVVGRNFARAKSAPAASASYFR